MNTTRTSRSSLSSSHAGIYTKLFQGVPPEHFVSSGKINHFWTNLLALELDRTSLVDGLNQISKEDCLSRLKPVFCSLFSECLLHARTRTYDVGIRSHALETLSIVIRYILAKNLAGWEVMEIFAGGVDESDKVFMELTATIDAILGDVLCPSSLRHQCLQLAIIFMCSISQLSPGAFFLRRDLFTSISVLVKSPDTERFTFEAVLLMSILANFHKSDAAKLNPYLRRIKETDDKDLMRKICWASNYAVDAAVKAYQDISDDSEPTLAATFGALLTSLRPDRALSSTPIDPPRELFKNQPIEATVVLLPIFEFLHLNPIFPLVLLESISDPMNPSSQLSPPPFTFLTASSYLLTHASSTSSPRAIAYANLSLNILLTLVESDDIMNSFCKSVPNTIRLCRQRQPLLPIPPSFRAPICALLDCCVLWLRHNLHRRLEVSSYLICIWVCHRTLWFLQTRHIRLEYDWAELWRAVIGLLGFLSNKLDSLMTTGGVERLAQETLAMLDFALCQAETFLPTPRAIHEFIYELIQTSAVLNKQTALLEAVGVHHVTYRRASWQSDDTAKKLARLLSVTDFYGNLVAQASAQTAKDAMKIVAQEIEKDGLRLGTTDISEYEQPPKRSEDVLGFVRYACMDGLSLMP